MTTFFFAIDPPGKIISIEVKKDDSITVGQIKKLVYETIQQDPALKDIYLSEDELIIAIDGKASENNQTINLQDSSFHFISARKKDVNYIPNSKKKHSTA